MAFNRRTLLAGAAAGAALPLVAPLRHARAQAANTIRIGVLNDQSGLYRDLAGPGSTQAVRLAVRESGITTKGVNVEVIEADHQNKPDVGSTIVRQWLDRDGVDVVVDVPTSSVALAVNTLCRERDKVFLNSTAATSDLTGPACAPTTVHWTYDTWMLAHGTGAALVQSGGRSWFFITADYAFGHALERDTAEFVRKAGGRVVGSVRTPFPGTTDFSSFLLQAQASGAQVIGLANAGGDTINCIKQAAEFGITRSGQRLAGLLVFLTDVHALGLQTAQGLVLTESFYWDLNDRTRDFTRRLGRMPNDVRPTMAHAGCYAAVLHYLKAVEAMGVAAAKASGSKAVEQMKAMPTSDDCFGEGTIRPDGRKIHPAYLFQVKAPAESKGPWDYYKLLNTIPANEAFRPITAGNCPLVRT
ncbi:ABC transporter substrate-binding protein [Elioraea sp. Yellowstone]|jgi:branched-chain amino acid transport system substrate-binding protein|uniref:ABC transporter substrate-binding protein n=1 Tax=Elioraea sp. Yellowstone TaxID=2592070 RepID=UPI00114F7EAE|nr:ABC transporter substrate-binding protein [Elioraea sp. Yellowstone]TQF83867.1 ABC transporter substrate-binding protein [Elioraea sp. Yellowstone]